MREYVETWKRIAKLTDRSERWCRYTADRKENPLPIVKYGGRVRIYVDAFLAWVSVEHGRTRLGRGRTALAEAVGLETAEKEAV